MPLIRYFMMKKIAIVFILLISFTSCKNDVSENTGSNTAKSVKVKENNNPLIYPEEENFKSLRQVTFGGDNAEAYWSFDDKQLVFQSNNAIKCF